jgi:hypothetical protein
MYSRVTRHTVTFGSWKTSISLEDAFWFGLQKIARRKRTTVSKLVEQIACGQHEGNAPKLKVLDPNRPIREATNALQQDLYSITSSASASSAGGTVRPSARADWAFTISSNFSDCMTGMSFGLAPMRIRPT